VGWSGSARPPHTKMKKYHKGSPRDCELRDWYLCYTSFLQIHDARVEYSPWFTRECTHPDARWLEKNDGKKKPMEDDPTNPVSQFFCLVAAGKHSGLDPMGYPPSMAMSHDPGLLSEAAAAGNPYAMYVLIIEGWNDDGGEQTIMRRSAFLGCVPALKWVIDIYDRFYFACLNHNTNMILETIEAVVLGGAYTSEYLYAVAEATNEHVHVCEYKIVIFGYTSRPDAGDGGTWDEQCMMAQMFFKKVQTCYKETHQKAIDAANAWTCAAKRGALCNKDMRGMIAQMIWEDKRAFI